MHTTTWRTIREAVTHHPGALYCADGLHRSRHWLQAEEGRVSPDQFYIWSSGILASCYAIPHTAVHRTYATWEILCGAPIEHLIQRAPQPQRESASAELASVRARLSAEATDTLAVVTPGCVFPGITLPQDVDSDALHTLARQVEVQARELGLPVVEFGNVRDDTAAGQVLHKTLQTRGYTAVTVGADAILDTSPYANLDAYFASFRAHRRNVLRRERRLFLDTHPTVRVDGPDGLTADLASLQLDRYRRYGHEADTGAVHDRFARAARIPGLKVLRADAVAQPPSATAPQPLGFIAFYEDRRTHRILTRLGAFGDRSAAVYFNIAYYELLSHAVQVGGMRIHYGDSTYLAKTLRGCELARLTSYFRADDDVLHNVLTQAGRLRTALEEQQLTQTTEGGSPVES
ncbi:hypothetical protein AB0O76_01155 [Streptomyces sp. NPDC086554]|uniref:hypothetical protein n=1 Tax=Streptomyces sp. NPDC086554 TaxID=3154864 RepID=UPI00343BA0DA